MGWFKLTEGVYDSSRVQNFRNLCQLENRVRLQMNPYSHLLFEQRPPAAGMRKMGLVNNAHLGLTVIEDECASCGGSPELVGCKKFGALSVPDRRKLVWDRKFSSVLLRRGHRADRCLEKAICGQGGCLKPHHCLLHQPSDGSFVGIASYSIFAVSSTVSWQNPGRNRRAKRHGRSICPAGYRSRYLLDQK